MPVQVYSMEGCDFCKKAKEKLDILGFPYEDEDIQERIKYRPGWREDGSIELLAAFAMADSHPPVIRVGEEYHGYSKAMLVLKRMKPGQEGTAEQPKADGVRALRDEARAPSQGSSEGEKMH